MTRSWAFIQAAVAESSKAARGARWPRAWAAGAVALATTAGVCVLAIAALPLGARLFVEAIELAARAAVWLVLAFQGGLDVWGVLVALGRRVAALLVTPRVTLALVAIELVGAVALYALQRLMVSDKESHK